jgi:hypothetical protein
LEYQILQLDLNAGEDTETLNEWAAEGWELKETMVLPGFIGLWRSATPVAFAILQKPDDDGVD